MKRHSSARNSRKLRPTPHGVGGLKPDTQPSPSASRTGPTPHGVGGLKPKLSTPARGRRRGPTPHGVGGLKRIADLFALADSRPTPHGVGGLKHALSGLLGLFCPSHPARGGWIETTYSCWPTRCATSHPARGGWIETCRRRTCRRRRCRPTPHGVGGLIRFCEGSAGRGHDVPPRTGWVD